MSWLRRDSTSQNPDDNDTQPTSDPGVDPETAARRRARLERRISNLEHDIERAASVGQPDNHWSRRIGEIEAAIKQAGADAGHAASVDSPQKPVVVPASPVEDIVVTTNIPATVTFRIAGESFRYSEEVDWTERGEQRSQPGLRRFAGDPARLIPVDAPPERRDALAEHLRHAIGALAIQLCDEGESAGQDLAVSLLDLATPCPICGNWRDLQGRCISCQRREWLATEIRADVQRLIEDRNQLLDELGKQREALPILQRQLRDARAELEKYSAS